jgi:succinate-semialdehyde dehydrogenase/glutarate-semialdehyde dehydrogenase
MASSTLVDPATRAYRTVNPATGEVVREYDTLSNDAAESALARAHAAFLAWRETSLAERVRLFRRFAGLIDANAGELARLTTLEMGKPLVQSVGEISVASSIFRYYADYGEELLADEETSIPGLGKAVIRREPVGWCSASSPGTVRSSRQCGRPPRT